MALELYRSYFVSGCEDELNVPAQALQQVHRIFADEENSLARHIASISATPLSTPFDMAEKSVVRTLGGDCLPRFLRSAAFKNYMQIETAVVNSVELMSRFDRDDWKRNHQSHLLLIPKN